MLVRSEEFYYYINKKLYRSLFSAFQGESAIAERESTGGKNSDDNDIWIVRASDRKLIAPLSKEQAETLTKTIRAIADVDKSLGGVIENVYLYGSVARGTSKRRSDIDLFLTTRKQMTIQERHPFMEVIPYEPVEVDVHFSYQPFFEESDSTYHQNKEEGLLLWKRHI